MKKTALLVLGIWLLGAFGMDLEARGRRYRRDGYRTDRGVYGYSRSYSRRYENSIRREIRQNERRIYALERNLYRHGYGMNLGLIGGAYHARRAIEVRQEIRRLQDRNRYLYSLLNQGW